MLEHLVSKFWCLEEYESKNSYTLEEKACKNNFDNTVQRGDDGRFIVHLPFRDSVSELGNSYSIDEEILIFRKETSQRQIFKE